MSKLIRLPEVQVKTGGLSRTTIWRLESAGCFPKRRIVSERIIAWDETEIDAWIRSRDQGIRAKIKVRRNTKKGTRKLPPEKETSLRKGGM